MFLELDLDRVHITFFLFLLKLPMIDMELLAFVQKTEKMISCSYLDILHALSESSMIRICHRCCHKIEIFE